MRLNAIHLAAIVSLLPPALPCRAQDPRRADPNALLSPGAVARLGDARLLHGDRVIGLSLSPDGSIALGADEARICLWETESGYLLREFKGLDSPVEAAALSPDGKLVAAVGRETEVWIWDAATGKVVHRLERKEGWANGVCWSPDSEWIASGTRGDVLVWSAKSGKLLHTFKAGRESTCIAISADRKRLVSGGWHSAYRVWDTETGKELCTLPGVQAYFPIRFAPDGKSLIGGHEERREGILHTNLRVWDADTGKKLYDVEGCPRLVGFLPDGMGVLVSFNGTVRLWDMKRRESAAKWNCGDTSLRALSGDGKWVAGELCGRARTWNLATGKERCPRSGHTGGVTTVSFSPDGKSIASHARNEMLRVWVWPTGRELHQQSLNFDTGPLKLAHLSDGNVMLLRHWTTTDLGWHWDHMTRRTKTHHKGEVYAEELAVSGDGKRIYTSGRDGAISVWDLTKGKELRLVETAPGPVGKDQDRRIKSASLSPDGRRLAWTARDYHPEKGFLNDGGVIEVDTGRRVATFKVDERSEDLELIAYSPDGTTVATCGESGSLRLWHPETGKQVAEWEETRGNALVFSPDGRFIAVGGTEIAIWDVAARKEVVRFRGHLNAVTALAFEPRGRVLVSASADGTLLVWDLTGRMKGAKLPSEKLSDKKLEAAWDDLGSDDPMRAQRAVAALACAAPDSVAFIEKRLKPVPVVTPVRLTALVADLGASEFKVRESATRHLAALGEVAEPALRQALKSEDPEVRDRAAELLRPLGKLKPSAEQLRGQRGVAALEYAGGREARRLLLLLAGGDPAARLTRQAQGAAERLTHAEGGK